MNRRVALLGHGAMGRRHARILGSLPELYELTGVFEPNPAAVTGYDGKLYASESEAMAEAELVWVASPIAAHADTVDRATRAGRAVFVEKPMGATRGEVLAMKEAAGGTPGFFVGHSERFNPVIVALASLVPSESITGLRFVRVGSPRSKGREVLLNLGVHDLDLAAYLMKTQLTVERAEGAFESASLTLETPRGVRVGVFAAREGKRERSIRVETAECIYRGDLLSFALTVTSKRDHVSRTIPLSAVEPLVAQARAIARSLDGQDSPAATAVDGALAVTLAEDALDILNRDRKSSASWSLGSAALDHLEARAL